MTAPIYNPDLRNRADAYWWRKYLGHLAAQHVMRDMVGREELLAMAAQCRRFALARGEHIEDDEAEDRAWDAFWNSRYDEWFIAGQVFVEAVFAIIIETVSEDERVNVRGWWGWRVGRATLSRRLRNRRYPGAFDYVNGAARRHIFSRMGGF